MNSEPPAPGLRPCQINGHQTFWEGWFHGAVFNQEAKAYVEDVHGRINVVDMYLIRFLDRETDMLY